MSEVRWPVLLGPFRRHDPREALSLLQAHIEQHGASRAAPTPCSLSSCPSAALTTISRRPSSSTASARSTTGCKRFWASSCSV